MDELLKEDLDSLKHMLGMNYSKKNWGYRNYYACTIDSIDEVVMQKLVRMGYATKSRQTILFSYYHATDKGCIIAGLSKKTNKKGIRIN